MNFFQKVYEIVKSVPKGSVISYGGVASLTGNPRMSRRVGQALHVNPDPKNIPCHRVVFKDGSLAHSYAFGGESWQKKLLEEEGVEFDEEGKVKREYFVNI